MVSVHRYSSLREGRFKGGKYSRLYWDVSRCKVVVSDPFPQSSDPMTWSHRISLLNLLMLVGSFLWPWVFPPQFHKFSYIESYMHIHAYIHTYMHACMHACICYILLIHIYVLQFTSKNLQRDVNLCHIASSCLFKIDQGSCKPTLRNVYN